MYFLFNPLLFLLADPEPTGLGIDARNRHAEVAHSLAWKKLLHYKKNVLGHEKSLVDGPGFFLSPHGAFDPLAELQATLAAFRSPSQKVGVLQIHPQCAFPARKAFLQEQLGLSFPSVKCQKLDEFLQGFKNVKNISLVFSSAYIQNPASMFGHTFLKINTHEGTPLKDLGINYAARVADDENPFAFIYFGIMGGYTGQWSTETYFNKVRDYAQGENRDLWEYEIDLTPQETLRLIEHLWEIETNGYFYYYFFDENCSYQILAALEAIKPQWDLQHHRIYMIPGESLKNLYSQPGLVKSVKLRPSLYRQVGSRFERLRSDQRQKFFQALKTSELPPSLDAPVLETLMWYFDYLHIKKKGKLDPREVQLQKGALMARAQLGSQPEFGAESEIRAETRPDLGHDSYMASLTQGVRDPQNGSPVAVTKFRWRSAYHDLMNRDEGYKKNAQIEFPAFEMVYDDQLQKLRLESVNVLNIYSLPPLNFLSSAPAWKVDMGVRTARDYGCLTCRHAYLDLGLGGAYEPQFEGPLMFYGLLTLSQEFYRQLEKGLRFGPGVETGLIWNGGGDWKIRFNYSSTFFVSETNTPSSGLEVLSFQGSYTLQRNLELRWSTRALWPREWSTMNEWSHDLSLLYFFR